MPRLGKSLELSFDRSCYTGSFRLFDNQGSTCSSGGPYLVGFPFVVHPGSVKENILTVIIDIIPAAVLMTILALAYRSKKPAGS